MRAAAGPKMEALIEEARLWNLFIILPPWLHTTALWHQDRRAHE
jgi:hypothetical protein